MDKEINIKELLNKWKEELKSNLKNKKCNIHINLFLIPKEWERKTKISFNKNLFNELKYFYKKISNDNGETIFPESDFLVIRNIYIKSIKNEFIIADAQYSVNKLVVDLGGNNYYFFYLNTQNNICEGYIKNLKGKIDEDFVDNFNENSINNFVTDFLSNVKYKILKNTITFNLTFDNIVFKDNQELINSLKKTKINNYMKNDDNYNSQVKSSGYRKSKLNEQKYKDIKNDDNNNSQIKPSVYRHNVRNKINEQKSKDIKNNDNNNSQIKSVFRNNFRSKIQEQKSKNIKNNDSQIKPQIKKFNEQNSKEFKNNINNISQIKSSEYKNNLRSKFNEDIKNNNNNNSQKKSLEFRNTYKVKINIINKREEKKRKDEIKKLYNSEEKKYDFNKRGINYLNKEKEKKEINGKVLIEKVEKPFIVKEKKGFDVKENTKIL